MKPRPTIDVCVSTMNHRVVGLVGALPKAHGVRYLVGVQITDAACKSMPSEWDAYLAERPDILMYRLDSIGLSRSRNQLMALAESDIVLFADDDVRFRDSFSGILQAAYGAAPDATAITFVMSSKGGRARADARPVPHSHRSLMSVSSIEISISRERVMAAGVSFDEMFGLGAKWPSGEEFIFLSDVLRNGGKVLFCPKVIVNHDHPSSGPTYFLSTTGIRAKGAMFERVFGHWKGKAAAVLFAVKKYPEYRAELGLVRFCRIVLGYGSVSA